MWNVLCVGGRDAFSVIGSAFLVLERPGAQWALLAGLLRALAEFSPTPPPLLTMFILPC